MMKKWIIGVVSSVILMPIIVFSWGNIQAIWAGPEKTEKIEKALEEQEESLEQVADLLLEQKNRQEKHEAVFAAQLELIADMKRRR